MRGERTDETLVIGCCSVVVVVAVFSSFGLDRCSRRGGLTGAFGRGLGVFATAHDIVQIVNDGTGWRTLFVVVVVAVDTVGGHFVFVVIASTAAAGTDVPRLVFGRGFLKFASLSLKERGGAPQSHRPVSTSRGD